MEQIKKEFIIWFSKWWTIIVYIFMGTVSKISYDILNRKKLSWTYIFAIVGISWTIGGMSAVWCMTYHTDWTAFVVPLCTMFSDRILLWVGARDWTPLLEAWYNFMNGKKKP